MPINRDLNVSPYYDDYNIAKKYYRVLFKPGYAVQARELTQLQTILQNQVEQFGDNIFKEGSIVKGCTFTDLSNLSYVKVVDGIIPTAYTDKTEIAVDDTVIEYYYEAESASGLKAYIVAAANGFQSKAPDLNTFFINYLNTVESTQQKVFTAGETINIKEYRIVKQTTTDPVTLEETVTEVLEGGNTVATTTVATFSTPTGQSYGLSVSEGIIYQKGHFLYVDEQTVVLVKYMPQTVAEGEFFQPHDISVGFRVDEDIINSQQDPSLLDNANGSENENAPGADRLMLSPVLVSVATSLASDDSTFFSLRKYENGSATQIRDVSQYNTIGEEMARRTYEESGDYVTRPFSFSTVRKANTAYIKVGPGTVYAKGYRVSNEADIFLPISDIAATGVQSGQPISFDYGGYVDVINANTATGIVELDGLQTVDLLASDGVTTIGTAIVKNYTTEATIIDSSTVNNSTKGRLYLFGIRMEDQGTEFSSVAYVKNNNSAGTGKIEITPKIRNGDQSRLIFDLGQNYIKNLSNINIHTRKKSTVSVPGGTSDVVITPGANEVFTADSMDHILVVGENNTRLVVTNVSITPLGNLAFTVSQTGGTITVYYNVRISPTLPRAKQSVDVFVKTTYTSTGVNAKTKYTLGISDGYKLLSVNGSDGKDYTTSFKFVTNQRSDFYDHSYIEYIDGRPQPPDGVVLTVNFSAFRPDSSGVYNMFTVNSYSGIDPADIPYFAGKSGTYNLRDCIDFRPHRLVLSGVTYATTEAAASTIASTVFVGWPAYEEELFSSSDTYVFPSLSTVNAVDTEYYLNRTDVVAVDSYGNFSLVAGEEAVKSRAPTEYGKTPIANVYLPGFPTYTEQEASDRGKTEYGVKITPVGVQNYTMKDIKAIDDKIERLSYYVTLSALEAETKNLLIRDENGLDRFKNGIIVDPFNDLSIADAKDPKFSASVDFVEKSLAPAVQTFPINLKVASASGAQVNKSSLASVTTTSSSIPVISQQYVTGSRSATSNFYKFKGNGFVVPEYDGAYDTTTNPKRVDLDLTDSLDGLVDAVQEFLPLTSSEVVATDTTSTRFGNSTIVDTTQTIKDTVSSIQSSATKSVTKLGDFVTDIRFKPFMRARPVKIFMSGLRPNTRHYFFFEGEDINQYVAPAKAKESIRTADNVYKAIGRSGKFGTAVTTDSQGRLFAVFSIPKGKFYVGDAKLEIADINDYDSISTGAVSKGTLTYRAYNFSIEKTRLTLSTRIPEYTINTKTTNRTVTDRQVTTEANDWEFGDQRDGGPQDPLAQTFFIKRGMSPKAGCIYASKIDLFFKRKSPINGVKVMLREVVNGYPSSEIIPFSKVHLTPSEVNVSEDGSVATTVTFRAPVRLDVEKEYAFVIQPDASDPDYLVYISKVGERDLSTNKPVRKDTFDGVLFTSTNNRAWTSYQDEDVKFTLYRYAFSTTPGTLTLETDNVEFFTLSDWANKFSNGDLVYTLKANTISATFTQGSDIVTGTAIGSTYQVGDYIYVQDGSGTKELFAVTSVAGNNNSVTIDENATFSGTYTTTAAVAGSVAYYNKSKPQTLYLEASSARSARKFEAGDTILSLSGVATGTIGSIDNLEVSFIRPSVQRMTDITNDVKMSAIVVDPELPTDTPYTKNIFFDDKTLFNKKGCVIYSKSNDTAQSKNLKIQLRMINNNDRATPIVDVETAFVFASRYYIDDSSNPISKYISKTVTLAEGFDAEDFRLYITGYRPVGTDLKPFIRLLNAADPQNIDSNPWIPLDLKEGIGMYTSSTNTNDFREYVYEITNTAGSNYGKTNGVAYYTNSTGRYTGYKSFQIKIEMTSSKIGVVPRMLDYRGVALE